MKDVNHYPFKLVIIRKLKGPNAKPHALWFTLLKNGLDCNNIIKQSKFIFYPTSTLFYSTLLP